MAGSTGSSCSSHKYKWSTALRGSTCSGLRPANWCGCMRMLAAQLSVSVVPALKSGILGLSGISALLVKCVSNGAANAFLTLRVGEIARRYCALTSRHSPEAIRRSATAAAVQHLGRIVRENGALVVRKIWASTGRALIDSGVSKAEDIAGATRDLFGKMSPWRLKEEDSVTL